MIALRKPSERRHSRKIRRIYVSATEPLWAPRGEPSGWEPRSPSCFQDWKVLPTLGGMSPLLPQPSLLLTGFHPRAREMDGLTTLSTDRGALRRTVDGRAPRVRQGCCRTAAPAPAARRVLQVPGAECPVSCSSPRPTPGADIPSEFGFESPARVCRMCRMCRM